MSAELQTKEVGKTEKNVKKRRGTWLLLLLLVVLILFLWSTIILGSRLYDLVTQDQRTVDIALDELNGKIDLFRIEYTNEAGEVTVHGINGEKVVAPGTTIDYDVRLRNSDDVVIDFLMTPSARFLTEDEVPIEFKVLDTYGNYILGSETEWEKAAQLNTLAHKGSIHPGEVFTYHVSWRWVFESGEEQDAYDTYLGNQDGQILPGIAVSMETQASANLTPVRDNHHIMHLMGRGFGCCWCCYLVWFLLLVAVLLLIWVWRLRKKLRNQEETMKEYEKVLEDHGLMIAGKLLGSVHGKE